MIELAMTKKNEKQQEYGKLAELLSDQYQWPDYYLFKFIVPNESIQNLKEVLSPLSAPIEEKVSKNGNYISVSVRVLIKETEEVIKIYESVKEIDRIMVL